MCQHDNTQTHFQLSKGGNNTEKTPTACPSTNHCCVHARRPLQMNTYDDSLSLQCKLNPSFFYT